ncbi:gluzincin family metallopeptidase [Krasilnikoviella flava]|uniref:Peptidase family M1 n=1 Tax=Krasilnikoviella flava TaxID=526729 RepID=A0A1T5ISR5_9MICO|nr:M1 family metallopeptidase [Krasilnikoviella flava]SKC42165.1 hypothetical protein SAMN04324258_0883 [Krasilnikoviella flava]
MTPLPARRRRAAPTAALPTVLGAGLVAALLLAGPAAVADEGLTEESHSRYVLRAKDTEVRATMTTTIGNVTPDRGLTYYYYTSYAVPVPAGAQDVRATSGGASLPVRLEGTDDPSTRYAVATFAPLRYGSTRTIEWSFVVPGEPVRSEDYTRVGDGFATFATPGVGDAGRTTVEVVLPASMTFDATSDVFTHERSGKTVTYTATENTDKDGIWAVVSARDPKKADEKAVEVGDTTLTLQSFPGDERWTRFVAKRLTTGLPVLEDLVGRPWPGGLDTIREDVSPKVLGYAWFDPDNDEIVIPEDLDEATLYHELGHAWLNPDRLKERWLSEGMTEVVAHRVVALTGGKSDPWDAPDRDADVAVPLSAWDARPGELDEDAEAYGYAASYTVVQKLLGNLDDDTFTAVVSAAQAGQSAYERPGSTDENWGRTDWRRFLDLVETRGEVAGAPKVLRTWVLDADQRSALKPRAAARDAYAALDDADGAWSPPLGLRTAMTDWEFGDAKDVRGALDGAAQDAGAVQAAAEAAGLDVPAPVRAAYEGASGADDYAGLATLLPRAAAVMTRVGEAGRAAAADRDPVSGLGALVLGVDRASARAQADLAAGDLDAAASRADAAAGRADAAPWVGAGLVVLVLGAAGGVAALVVRRRRRAGSAAGASVVVEDALEEGVVLPAAGDPEVPRSGADAVEPGPRQHLL